MDMRLRNLRIKLTRHKYGGGPVWDDELIEPLRQVQAVEEFIVVVNWGPPQMPGENFRLIYADGEFQDLHS